MRVAQGHIIRCIICGNKIGISNEEPDLDDLDMCERCEKVF